MVSRRIQLQRSLSETRGTDNSGTTSWPTCQECLHHNRMVSVCQNTLVILHSITLNNGLLPFLGHSFFQVFLQESQDLPEAEGMITAVHFPQGDFNH